MNWKRFKRSASDNGWSGFLDKTVRMEGIVEAPGLFTLEAQFKGRVVSSGSLTLGEGARVEGEIEGNHVIVYGRFDGVLAARGRVEIMPRGIVTGEVHTPCLVIEPGGIFDGYCHMLAATESAKPVTIPIRVVRQG